ncbi:MAG: D-alanyl-D-alanine carboxypeptidase/D-alanyl-D-alanine-endopeptidase [Thermomicrobiales bacterium]|nr:D-alanyl-D-alanine carboxypeptidase/D-alanyl-D-alanine-endopeptidase [Thermomicrobiales bacterium]
MMTNSRYAEFTRWGVFVADRASGEPIYGLREVERFIPGSVTKLYPAAAALDAYGSEFRFRTPLYRTGALVDGVIDGDLVLVASGDPTMGGRDQPDGTMAFTETDHTYANVLPGAQWTDPDPLAGLDDLARQAAAAGVERISGDVIVDARLWPQMAKGEYVLSPIAINDNVIDLLVSPGIEGQPATLEVRPRSAAFQAEIDVTTVGAEQPLALTVDSPGAGRIVVRGQIAEGSAPALRIFQIEDPPAFARTLLIEALEREGIAVASPATGPNPTDRLPDPGSYRSENVVATHESLPFAQLIRVTLKVSMNEMADVLVFLLALKRGADTFDAGLQVIGEFLDANGLARDVVSLGDGRGIDVSDLFGPRAICALLLMMAERADFDVFYDALPILGVDGTERAAVPTDSLVKGRARAKSGTSIASNPMNQRLLVLAKASAGYLTGASGREVVYAVFMNDTEMTAIDDVFGLIDDQGAIAEALYAAL